MEGIEERKIEDILIEAGLIDQEKLEEIKSLQQKTGEKLEKVLLSEGINYKKVQQMMARKMGVEYIDLETVNVNAAAIQKVNQEVARKYFVFPFDIKDNLLYLAMQNPDDIFKTDEIKMFTQMEIKPFLADSRLINKAISFFYADTLQGKTVYFENWAGGRNSQRERGNKSEYGADEDDRAKKPGCGSVEEFMQRLVMDSLKAEYISSVYIDTDNRNINVTFNIRY